LDFDPGTLVAQRFRILRPLGRGGMGEVFAAENLRTGRQVAVKLLRSESKLKSSAIERFRREARAAGSIQSDYVTQILDVDEDPEHGIVLVFELLEGESLVDRLKRTGPIPFDELHRYVEEIWMGLADAHRAGIIHRDLKPSNVFLERRPSGPPRIKLLDFGISKLPREMGGETLTELGQSLGTFSFMPPEQIGKAKTVDHRADIYACASLIYQALSGQLPYAAKNILMMVELKTKQEPRRLSAAMEGPVDPRLDDFLAVGLARDPQSRFQSADDALAAWRALAGAPAGRATVGQPGASSRADVAVSPLVAQGHGSMHGQGGPHATPIPQSHAQQQQHPSGQHPSSQHQSGHHQAIHAPQSHAGHAASQPYPSSGRPVVSVPRVNSHHSDSWDDSVPSESGRDGEDAATVAIRRDQVGQAIQAYGRPSTPMPSPRTNDDAYGTTNQGTVMMMKSPLSPGQSMHRARPAAGAPPPQSGGMLAPALMPPMQQPVPASAASSMSGMHQPLAQPMQGPPPKKSGTATYIIGAFLVAIASFAIIAVVLELMKK
jgi:serine/threonine protein kinase